MKIINKLRDYILEDEFRINILENRVNVANYTEIGTISNDTIYIYHDDNKIVINGKNLVISRLQDNEVMITGFIKGVELG